MILFSNQRHVKRAATFLAILLGLTAGARAGGGNFNVRDFGAGKIPKRLDLPQEPRHAAIG